MRARMLRAAWVIPLAVACLAVALGAGGGVARATGAASATHAAPTFNARRTEANIRALQIALQSYSVDHGDLWPPDAAPARLRGMLLPYLDRWPWNPYTDRPMREKKSAGNFTYSALSGRTRYRLVGWGRHGRSLIAVP